jgi:hypothetical protein
MKHVLIPLALALSGAAMAKLPPPSEEAKAKAAETAAKNAWQAKVNGYQLCKAQDKVAAQYRKTSGGTTAAKDAKAAAPAAADSAAAAPTPAATAAAAPPPAGAAPGTAAPTAAGAAAASGTPVAYKPPPPCQDPGPFAYNPPAQKPLETSGAHSPSGTAASPPSVKEPSAAMMPAKKPWYPAFGMVQGPGRGGAGPFSCSLDPW